MRARPTLAALILLTALPRPGLADSERAPALKGAVAVPIQAYGRQNPRCGEWTNGCVVCTATDGHAQCSTPGIACTPAGLTCKRLVKP